MIVSLGVALGIGLLIGAERERHKQVQPQPSAAGIRTFTVSALAGAVSFLAGGVAMLAVATGGVIAFAALSYWRLRDNADPGLTTEIALVLTALLGGLAVREPLLAAGVGTVVAIMLAAKTPLHHFVGSVLTEDEVRDALILAGATLVVLPLLPDRAMGPFNALNPRAIWSLVVLVLAIGAIGHVAVRLLGARYGLPLAGLASGFISSTATIGAMGQRSKKEPGALGPAVAGAVLSTVATIIQMAAVVGTVSLPSLQALAVPLICAGLAAGAYGGVFTLMALKHATEGEVREGHAFSLTSALIFGSILSMILLVSAALSAWFGGAGAVAAAAVAGLVDTHAAAISIAALVAAGQLTPAEAVVPILAGLTTNTVSKLVFARANGTTAFQLRVAPGLILVAAAAWCGLAAVWVMR